MSSSLDYEMETYADGTELDAAPDFGFGAEDEEDEEDDDEGDDDMDMEDEDDDEEADDELAKPAADDNDVRRHLRGTRQLRVCSSEKYRYWSRSRGRWVYTTYACYRWSPRRQRCVIRRRCMW